MWARWLLRVGFSFIVLGLRGEAGGFFELSAELRALHDELAASRKQSAILSEDNSALRVENKQLRQEHSALRLENAALRSELSMPWQERALQSMRSASLNSAALDIAANTAVNTAAVNISSITADAGHHHLALRFVEHDMENTYLQMLLLVPCSFLIALVYKALPTPTDDSGKSLEGSSAVRAKLFSLSPLFVLLCFFCGHWILMKILGMGHLLKDDATRLLMHWLTNIALVVVIFLFVAFQIQRVVGIIFRVVHEELESLLNLIEDLEHKVPPKVHDYFTAKLNTVKGAMSRATHSMHDFMHHEAEVARHAMHFTNPYALLRNGHDTGNDLEDGAGAIRSGSDRSRRQCPAFKPPCCGGV